MKAEAVNGAHLHLLGLYADKLPCKQNERILVIRVHVLDDSGHCVGQRVRIRGAILGGRNPAHHAETAHIVDVKNLHPVKGKIVEVHPVLAVFVSLQVEVAHVRQLFLCDPQDISNQRNSRRT